MEESAELPFALEAFLGFEGNRDQRFVIFAPGEDAVPAEGSAFIADDKRIDPRAMHERSTLALSRSKKAANVHGQFLLQIDQFFCDLLGALICGLVFVQILVQ